jgi:Tfp pilus assembly protein PilO
MKSLFASKRILIAGLMTGVVIILWYHYLFREQQRNLTSLEGEIIDTETLVATWIAETKNLSEYQDKYMVLKEEQQRVLSKIPSIHQVDHLSRRLIALGKNYHCRITYFGIPFAEFFSRERTIGSSNGGEILVMPLQMVVEGDFASIGLFVDALSKLPFFTAFGEFEMRCLSNDGEELEMDLSMMIFLIDDESHDL